MERLEAKQVKGHTYYYYSKWAGSTIAVDASAQKYLGKLEDIVAAVHGGGPALFSPRSCRIHQAGLDISLRRLLSQLEDIREVINLYPKRRKAAKMRRNGVTQCRRSRSDWSTFSVANAREEVSSGKEWLLATGSCGIKGYNAALC